MNALGFSISTWVEKLKHSFVLRSAVGITDQHFLSASTHYDFMQRIVSFDDKPRLKKSKRMPSQKIGKNKKLPPKHPNIVERIVKKILSGRRLDHRPELLLQQIFAKVCVRSSLDMGILSSSLTVSGDGTCIKTGASSRGRTIYLKPDWDFRLFTRIPRGSLLWKSKMNERTACERVNNRILHNYGLEASKVRGKGRISFFMTIASFNIHLDAQLKHLKSAESFSILDYLSLAKVA